MQSTEVSIDDNRGYLVHPRLVGVTAFANFVSNMMSMPPEFVDNAVLEV